MSDTSPSFLTLTGAVSPPFVPKTLGIPEIAIAEDDKLTDGIEIPRQDKSERAASSVSALDLSPPTSPFLPKV
jgi:hypothetical protein